MQFLRVFSCPVLGAGPVPGADPGPIPGLSTSPRPKLVPVPGSDPGSVIFLVPGLVQVYGPITQWLWRQVFTDPHKLCWQVYHSCFNLWECLS